MFPKDDFREWCQQNWTLPGASTREHPAPYPLELASRLVRMFSFVGDTVLDPFAGTGTTLLVKDDAGVLPGCALSTRPILICLVNPTQLQGNSIIPSSELQVRRRPWSVDGSFSGLALGLKHE
jgi:hypothetical protein